MKHVGKMDERLRQLLDETRSEPSLDESSERELGVLLRASVAAPPLDVASLSAAALASARDDLSRYAARAYADRLVRALAVATLPLPFVTALAAWALPRMYAFLAGFLPDALAAVVVGSYGLAVALSVATAYASIPLLTERMSLPAPLVTSTPGGHS
ncbi:MAG: putative membrane protein [Hyphomicrobiaceae bacterium]